MDHIIQLTLTPGEAFDANTFQELVNEVLHREGFPAYTLLKRSIDARRGVKVHVQLGLLKEGEVVSRWSPAFKKIKSQRPVIIVGAGPAGLFAAIRCLEKGLKPLVIERGKDVQARRRDIALINREGVVNTDSNYCFGEGGAGTYSDGKLYTRSKKRGDVRLVLEILRWYGAGEEILYDAHPHIGTNKLPAIIAAMRESIVEAGGEVRFNTRVSDLLIEDGVASGVKTADGETIKGQAVILATGHSARDIYELLHQRKVKIEAKPFALGVRVEHQQSLIDQIQYHCEVERGPYLPASAYALTHQSRYKGEKRGVFSFCMCPGGFIVPSATSPGEIVVNGMSPSRRDSRFANSGIVVSVENADFRKYEQYGPLAGMYFQKEVEQQAFKMAGGGQVAPAQRLVDFVNGKVSGDLLETSYQPGLAAVNMKEVLPDVVYGALRQGFKAFGKKMKGYLTDEAQVVGVESRTSSPVRIPRDPETLEHVEVKGLYPCGEGAGYAGGIVSAAMDGIKVVEAILV